MTTPEDREPFLRRWSRLKQEAVEQAPAPEAAVKPEVPPPELPPVEQLTPASDFRDFMHPKVDEGLRRAALKKLFSDPHFNVMDGLDVYIDDYSKSDPLPAAMLAQLKQAQKILDWAQEKSGDAEPADTGAESRTPAAADEKRIASAEPTVPRTPAAVAAVAVDVPADERGAVPDLPPANLKPAEPGER